MSSLREMVAARRAPETGTTAPPPSAACQGRTLEIEPGGSERWLLPWSQFVSARYRENNRQEELTLRFAAYDVLVHGRRLVRLWDEIGAMVLPCLRTAPEAALAAHHGSDAVISRIEVRALEENEAKVPESS